MVNYNYLALKLVIICGIELVFLDISLGLVGVWSAFGDATFLTLCGSVIALFVSELSDMVSKGYHKFRIRQEARELRERADHLITQRFK